MTASEMKALVSSYGAENLLTIVYDNSLYMNFDKDHVFDINSIKTVNGVDVVEHTEIMSFNSIIPGKSDIPVTSVHPIEMVQALIFSPRDRRSEIAFGDLKY